MGAKNNHVFQILVTGGNKALLESGKKVKDLKPGQLGAFNAYTNLAVSKEDFNDGKVKDFYFAVGVDSDGDGVVDDISKSAGQMLQGDHINYLTYQPYVGAQATEILISDFKAKCETEYSINIKASNANVLTQMGYVPFKKSYHVMTGCCEDCGQCGTNYCNMFVKNMVEAVNNDEEEYFYAEAVDAEGDVVEDIDAYIEQNKEANRDEDKENDVCLSIKLTSRPNLNSFFCQIPAKAFKKSGTKLDVYLNEGFACTGKVEVLTPLRFEQGSALEIINKEYVAVGWSKSMIYRQSNLHGLPIGNFMPMAQKGTKYNQLILGYESLSYSGWGEYLNALHTTFAIPTSDDTTKNSLVEFLGVAGKKLNIFGGPTVDVDLIE